MLDAVASSSKNGGQTMVLSTSVTIRMIPFSIKLSAADATAAIRFRRSQPEVSGHKEMPCTSQNIGTP